MIITLKNHYKTNNTKKKKTIRNPPNKKAPINWKKITIKGTPKQRGFQHGYQLSNELKKIASIFPIAVKDEFNMDYNDYLEKTNQLIEPILKEQYPEFYNELLGIVEGATHSGVPISIRVLIGWNSFLSMSSYFIKQNKNRNQTQNRKERCSAFIATGTATKPGDIIMAHNTHTDFLTGQFSNIILTIIPETGIKFVMQTCAGLIASGTDWFITDAGIMGCETTIADINYKPEFSNQKKNQKTNDKAPYFCRIRQAMQYGKTLDEYVAIMLTNNAYDYSNSWLLGDINTGEIMRFEISKKIHSIERTHNGVFYGMNAPFSIEIREKETTNKDFDDIQTSSGMRNQRLNELLNETYYGKIDVENGKQIISDHYDILYGKEIMNSRGICKHNELEPNKHQRDLFGAMDGKITTTAMARKLEFLGIFGSACGKRRFNMEWYAEKNEKYKKYVGMIEDIGKNAWIKL